MPTHYERLGVQPGDDRDTVWRAYLSAVRSALSGQDSAAELRALDEAWTVLRDPDLRAAYDRELEESEAAAPAPGAVESDAEPGTPVVVERPASPEDAPAATEDAPAAPQPAAPGGWERSEPRRRRPLVRAAVWVLAFALAGAAAGLAVSLTSARADPFAEGSCVSFAEDEAVSVPCGSPDADGRIVAVVPEPGGCSETDGGWVERDDGRLACVELLGDG